MKPLPAQSHNMYRWLVAYADQIEAVIIVDYDGDGAPRNVVMTLDQARQYIDYEFLAPDEAMQIMAWSAKWVYFTVSDYAVSMNRVPRNPEAVA